MPPVPSAATIVVDVANVMGARPDGWWRDRAGAATRLLIGLDGLVGQEVPDPSGVPLDVAEVVAVVEGAARAAVAPPQARLRVVRAAADGDSAVIAEAAAAVAAAGEGTADAAGEVPGQVVVVTADRGLRAGLPAGAVAAGPRWVLGLLTDRG